MAARYAIGIDLGTTNSAIAYAPLDSEQPRCEILAIPQLVAPGTVESRPLLPSFLYLGSPAEASAGALDLPWAEDRDFAAGEMARRQSAEMPMRTVSAAKSWLAYTRVDRHQAILPPGAPPDSPRISPVAASQRYLEHMAAAWQAAFPDAPLAEQQVVLTVPASFDASARELTREAALAAGLGEGLVLLEEPQAALYAWLADTGEKWRRQLHVGDALLVCDVGGGTTDFTLIGVGEEDGELSLRRVAVGNHILVGGDNMDLALAHRVAEEFGKRGVQLDAWQSVSLWHSCRVAKETLLAEKGPKKHAIAILGRGSKLIKGTVSVDLEREAAAQLLLEGFLPRCSASDEPASRRASGFRELGLPYESDTAISRHLASFLCIHGEGAGRPLLPTYLLFNGGVFKSKLLRKRLLEVVAGWFEGSQPPRALSGNDDLDFAVARGAAYYAFAKQGRGIRIRGGTARSYYVGIETAGLAIPGAQRPLRAVCVVPMGMEEGTETDVPGDEIGLVVGQPSQFRFFSSAQRKEDKPGDQLARWGEGELEETAPLLATLSATLPAVAGAIDEYVPVRFHARITELGMLELWCRGTSIPGQWKLEFSVREDAGD